MKRALGLAFLWISVACGGSSSSPEQSENALQRLRWDALQIDRYRIEQRVICFCPQDAPSVIVTAVDGEIAVVENSETGEPLDPDRYASYYTVEQLFDLVDEAAAEAALLEVTYDETFFHPSRVNIDYIAEAVDDELLVESFDLVPLRD